MYLAKKVHVLYLDFVIVVGLFLIFSTLFSLLSVIRHNHFGSQGIDFTTYDQALWLYSRGERPYSTVSVRLDLADRFRPVMIPLSSIYLLTQNERVLLVFQAVILAAAALPIWLLTRRVTGNRLMSLVIPFLYLDFVGVQSAAAYDFHEMAVLPFLLAWLFYFMEREKWKSYFTVLILALSVREHVGFLLSAVGVYVWLAKRNIRVAILTSVISLAWSLVAILVLMPALGQKYYASFVKADDSLLSAGLSYLTNPLSIVSNFLWPVEKLATIFWSFLSFGVMGLLYWPMLVPVAFNFASRFLDLQHPIRWTLFYHYNLEMAVLLTVATIYGVKMVSSRLRSNNNQVVMVVIIVWLMTAHLLTNILLPLPLKNLLKPAFWQEEAWMVDTRLVVDKVPADASVQTQNNLMPHLGHRREIYILPIERGADYMVFDLHRGQNDWNFYTDNLGLSKKQFKELVAAGKYRVILSAGDAYLLKKL